MNISSATVGADSITEIEVREYKDDIEIRVLTPRTDSRPTRVWVDGKLVEL